MRRLLLGRCLLAVVGLGLGTTATAAIPFQEDFNVDAANWRFSNTGVLAWEASGGYGGSGYVSRTFAFSELSIPMAESATIFRAQDEYGSSGGQFAGNWLAEGVKRITAYVRHTAPQPLDFTVRVSNPNNFPGASYLSPQSTAVPANSWNQITFNVAKGSPDNLTYEGTNYDTVFSSIGHIQLGVEIPPSLRGSTTPFTFDLDYVRVLNIPEPAAGGLAALGLGSIVAMIRRRR